MAVVNLWNWWKRWRRHRRDRWIWKKLHGGKR